MTHPDGAHDFDFLHGRWDVSHRRLVRRLAGDDTWAAFGGTTTVWPILGGMGNVDDNLLELPEGAYRATTLRVFDPAAARWSIFWFDGRKAEPDPPLRGGFTGGIGTFFGDDLCDGRPVRVRFLWTPIDADHCRWEQAFSEDRERSWETNWIMTFSRAS
jgi:hypothetical protein